MAGPVILSGAKKTNWSVLLGASFIMATSAIGPGFLTQTAFMTEKFLASFGFAVLASIIIDIGAQMNVWRVIAVSRMRGQDVANAVFPGLGHLIAILIVMGGLAFNIGNVGGAGLGLNVLFGISAEVGAIISAAIAIVIFASKDAGRVMDRVAQTLGGLMILLSIYAMFAANPPVEEAVVKSFVPDDVGMLMLPIITIVGGTVGGYITFAGGHRLLDAGIVGKENLPDVNRSAVTGVVVTGIMRVILFLAALGVVTTLGAKLDPSNPAATVFQAAAGELGYKFFGVVLWCAAITSIIGCAYTSVSFLRSMSKTIDRNNSYTIMVFIIVSTLVLVTVGRPATILIFVGSLNGLILPLTLGAMLLGAKNRKIVGDYEHPTWLLVFGILAVLAAAWAGWMSLQGMAALWK
ncbi:MAG: divalent metal cation transporter [Candidatus Accumulibacter sp.]|jgi:Mn2+/Fe2+ NRAMP family transporter|nr:divalent metal cation transporter [Accumulibacter sp.]